MIHIESATKNIKSATAEDYKAWREAERLCNTVAGNEKLVQLIKDWRKAAHLCSDEELVQIYKNCLQAANEMHRKSNPVKAQFYEDLEWIFTDVYLGRKQEQLQL